MSVDSKNSVIRYGKDYLSVNLTLVEITLKRKTDGTNPAWESDEWTWLEKLKYYSVVELPGDTAEVYQGSMLYSRSPG